ncbi:MAG: HmuY family protein [Bacteroidales bacterium]|jgi:hypothetical protein|nr:HmuY family protein [Bacteroidales bacterium]
MKETIFLMTAAIVSCIVFFTSCGERGNGDNNNPAIGKTIQIDVASSWGTWNYFSFSKGEIVGTGDASETADAEWKARTDWDIAFTRLYARTNSGASGNGNGGVIEIEAENANKATVFANLVTAPSSDYIADKVEAGLMIAMGSPSGPTTYDAGSSATVNSWLTMAMPVEVKPKVFALKTADEKYVKIYLKSYQNDEGKSGVITMEYVYQADGTEDLSVSE